MGDSLADDPPGFIRRSINTDTILVRQPDGWITLKKNSWAPDVWSAHHYDDIGGWLDRPDIWVPVDVHHVKPMISRLPPGYPGVI